MAVLGRFLWGGFVPFIYLLEHRLHNNLSCLELETNLPASQIFMNTQGTRKTENLAGKQIWWGLSGTAVAWEESYLSGMYPYDNRNPPPPAQSLESAHTPLQKNLTTSQRRVRERQRVFEAVLVHLFWSALRENCLCVEH